MQLIKIYRLLGVILIAVMVSGCASWQNNHGKIRNLKESQNGVTIQDLVDKWDDYNVYYSDHYDGYNIRSPLGIMFDPKNNDTTLVGDLYEPWLNEILGPDGRFYGYLYYSYGFVTLKVVDDKTMYVFNLEDPREEGDGEPPN